jgi:hypothetical protein
MIVSRNKRRRIGPGRGRGRGGRRGAPARTWSQPRLPGPAREGPGGGVLARAVLFGSAAFVFVYVVAVVIVVDSMVPQVDRAGSSATQANWLLIPLELGGLLAAFAGGLLAAWLLGDAGERTRPRLFAWSMAGPLVLSLLLLAGGGFAGGPLRALLDLVVVAAGTWLGASVVSRRLAARGA